MDPWPIIITHYISILCLGYSERYFVIFVTVERMTWQTVAHNSFFFCAKIVASLTRPEPIVLWTIYCETRGPQPAKTRQCQCGGWRCGPEDGRRSCTVRVTSVGLRAAARAALLLLSLLWLLSHPSRWLTARREVKTAVGPRKNVLCSI